MTAPTLDGTPAGASVAGTNSTTVTVTTTGTNDVIVLLIGNEQVGASVVTVSSVTSTHLMFVRTNGATANSGGSNPWNVEEWRAPAAAALTSEVITVTWSGNVDSGTVIGFGVNGAHSTSSPYDTNGSLPAKSVNNTGSGNAAHPTFSTTQNNDFIYILAAENDNNNLALTGWTLLKKQTNVGGTNFCTLVCFYQQVTTSQSSVTPNVTGGGDIIIYYLNAITADAPSNTETGTAVMAFGPLAFKVGGAAEKTGTVTMAFGPLGITASGYDIPASKLRQFWTR